MQWFPAPPSCQCLPTVCTRIHRDWQVCHGFSMKRSPLHWQVQAKYCRVPSTRENHGIRSKAPGPCPASECDDFESEQAAAPTLRQGG
eukprot:370970-Rhodomonas_salina.3